MNELEKKNEKEVERINLEISKLSEKSLISDGSHTFDELYFHRMILFSVICKEHLDKSWKSKFHADGGMYEHYFVVGIDTKVGQFSYHYHMEYWDHFAELKELDRAPKWDGHLPNDVTRLLDI